YTPPHPPHCYQHPLFLLLRLALSHGFNGAENTSLNSGRQRETRLMTRPAARITRPTLPHPSCHPPSSHEKETVLEPFVLKDLLPSALGSYYRYTGSLTTPPCSKVVEWIIFSRPIYVSYKQLEAFYSIFTTEQQDHVKSVEYLRSNFRPIQSLDNRHVFKSAVKDAWMPDLTDSSGPYGTEASRGRALPLNVYLGPCAC
ncbi:Receptor-type tyrosine-protein phosphatase gamma, partial [Dissostichus eleginoides]